MVSWLRSLTSVLSNFKSRSYSSSILGSKNLSLRTLHCSSKVLPTLASTSSSSPSIVIAPCSSRPDLLSTLDSPTHPIHTVWPRFLTANTKEIDHLFEEESLLKWQFMAIISTCEGCTTIKERIIALSNSIPFHWSTPTDNNSLPDLGWEAVVRSGLLLNQSMKTKGYKGPKPNALCALAVAVDPSYRFKNTGIDLASELLNTMKTTAVNSDFSAFVLPVRPTGKAGNWKLMKMDFGQYCAKVKGEDDRAILGDIRIFNHADSVKVPWDPWIRKHVRMGGKVAKVAPQSTTIRGTKKQWEEWTGIDFEAAIKRQSAIEEETNTERSFDIMIPGGLVPVKYFPARDLGIYVEPNLWMRYF